MKEESTVFVIDNDPSARNGLIRLLLTAGYHVRDFASANEFLENFNPNESGCIVFDVGMPGVYDEVLLDKADNKIDIKDAD